MTGKKRLKITMTGNEKKWLSIAESVILTGISESTIRRKLKKLDKSDFQLTVKKTGKTLLISKDYLIKTHGIKQAAQQNPAAEIRQPEKEEGNELVKRLEEEIKNRDSEIQKRDKQIQVKDKQIDRLQTSVENLTKLNAQTNILIGQLQQKISIDTSSDGAGQGQVENQQPEKEKQQPEKEKQQIVKQDKEIEQGIFGEGIPTIQALILMIIICFVMAIIGVFTLGG